MTLIGGEKINWKWALFTDDCLTVWEAKISSSERYRPKLREMWWKNCHLIVASCWSTKDVDFVLNMLEAEIDSHWAKDTLGLQYQIQTVLMSSMKALKEIKEDPQYSFLILETTTDTLWATEEYSMFRVKDEVEIVFGSAEQNFHQLNYKWFERAFIEAVEANEYCSVPIYIYRDEKMYSYEWYEWEDMLIDFLYSLDKEDDINESGASGQISNLWSRGWLSSQETTKLWQNSRKSDSKSN